MGLFRKNKKEEKQPLAQLAGMISGNDDLVMAEVEACVEDTEAYFNGHKEAFEKRYIYNFGKGEEGMLRWLGMVDILEGNGYVCERDCSDEKEDFLHFVNALKGVKENGLAIDEEVLDEEEEVPVWCEAVDEQWERKGFCLAAIDIDSDSYVLFPAKIRELDTIGKYAKQAGYRIDAGKNL